MKSFISTIKILIYSNLFVSFCVTAFTHSTYLIYNLPKDNLITVLTLVFSFTYFTYNGQRLFRLHQKTVDPENIGERLKWVINNKTLLTISSAICAIIGAICAFNLSIRCWLLLIPMGIISVFYVVPLIPFYSKSPSLRSLPYLKILFIGLVWSLIIIGLPILDTKGFPVGIPQHFLLLLQNLFFVIAITLPFDIRDLRFDRANNLKTIPQLLGSTMTIVLAEVLLIGSIAILYVINLTPNHLIGISIGYALTMALILLTNEKRKELFFSGLIEGTVLIVYGCILISEYCFSL